MKNSTLFPIFAGILLSATGCDRESPDIARKLEELERKNTAALERQRELEQQLAEQRLASERDAIERERMLLEETREQIERESGKTAAEQDEAIRRRERQLAEREQKLSGHQSELDRQGERLESERSQLSAKERGLAGREALAFRTVQSRIPVGDYGMFYDSLSSYGSWFETPNYGYVWQPVVVRDRNWRPYSRGRWACSDRGWTWISEEPFGWATYHYGRWTLLRGRGWVWVPGSEWAPSWVSWRESGSHIGWAPLPPETLAYRGSSWDSSVDDRFGISPSWFNFIEIRHFGGPIYSNCVPVTNNVTIIRNTTNITHIHVSNRQVISGGPRYDRLSERVGRTLPFYRIEMDRAQVSRDSVSMRPRVQGDRLWVAAPNVDAEWNEGLKPKRVKERLETVEVERKGVLKPEIAKRFLESRIEGGKRADRSIAELGGRGKFEKVRSEKLQENRERVATEVRNEAAKVPDAPAPKDEGKDRPVAPPEMVETSPETAVVPPQKEILPEVMPEREQGGRKGGARPARPAPTEPPQPEPAREAPVADEPVQSPDQSKLPEPKEEEPAPEPDSLPEPVKPTVEAADPAPPMKEVSPEEPVKPEPSEPIVEKKNSPAPDREKAGPEESSRREKLRQEREEAKRAAEQAAAEQREQAEMQRQQELEKMEQERSEKEDARQREQEEMKRQQQEEEKEESLRQQEEMKRRNEQEKTEQALRESAEMKRQQEEREEAIRQQEEARERQQEEMKRREEAQREREEELARRQQEQEQQEEMRRQQEQEREEARRVQEEARQRQQKEMQRQQEEARQRQQEEMQRQQEEARQRQQEEMQRQQEEQRRQQEEARQRQQQERPE